MRIIAFSGRDAVGKTTISNHIKNEFLLSDISVIVRSFADVLRNELYEYYNVPLAVLKPYSSSFSTAKMWLAVHGVDFKPEDPRYKDNTIIKFSKLELSNTQKELLTILWRECGIEQFKKVASIEDIEVSLRQLLVIHGTYIRRKMDKDYWIKKMGSTLRDGDRYTVTIIDDMRFPNEFNLLKSMGASLYWLDNDNTATPTNTIEADLLRWYGESEVRNYFTEINVPIPITTECCRDIYNIIKSGGSS